MAVSKRNSIFLFILSVALLISCKKKSASSSDEGSPGANEVWMKNTAFLPVTITVPVNTTITWTNKDDMDHNVTGNSGSLQSGTMGNGAKYSHQFTTAGTFTYNCTFHQGMNGTVIVQ